MVKKGDKITVLREGVPLQATVLGRYSHAWLWSCAERYDATSVFLIDVEKENVGWMRGWSAETSNALLASATMAEPAPKRTDPHVLGAVAGSVVSKIASAILPNPIVAAALGGIASLYVTEKLRPKK